ncbi:MAG TPA: DUF2281 domain-containing protein [Gemmatimonadaceae bacterium]|nr:DUF2281 domain-containing protein [Gemmatimonadaceae bacterium]
MNEYLRDRILRKLETLSEERLYQVLDFAEFLESKYAERPEESPGIFTRFAEAVEDRLRAGQVSATTIAETMGLMNRAMGVLGGVAAAGKSVANDIVGAARQSGRTAPAGAGSSTPAGGGSSASAGGGNPGPTGGSGASDGAASGSATPTPGGASGSGPEHPPAGPSSALGTQPPGETRS